MGYAGYAPGHRVVEAKTPLERALLDVPTVEAHDLLEKLILNVARSPTELKFRRLKASNAKIKREIIDVPEVLQVMTLLGWISETVEGEGEGLSLPANVTLTMREVRAVDEARIATRRRLEEEMRARIRAKSINADPTRAALQAQLAADRAERAAAEPVTQGSVAQQLGENRGVVSARDIGASGSSGC
jgi:hypothetical protein